jgi:hypothetical protein
MDYDLHGKIFRSVSSSANGDVGAETRFHYQQSGAVVTATYSGGEIVTGHLIAKVLDDGRLDMRYHHINLRGELMLGTCVSTPRLLADGRLAFSERWQWLSGDRSSGSSEIEEVVSDVDRD